MNLNKILILVFHIASVWLCSPEVKAATINEEVKILEKKVDKLSKDIVEIKQTQLDKSVAVQLHNSNIDIAGTSNASTLVRLNVGGKEYVTRLDILTKLNNTYFTTLLSKPSEMEVDDEGRIFIDRNADLFGYILNYLRTGEFSVPEDRHRRLLILEAEFFKLNDLVIFLSESYIYQNGTLLNFTQQNILNTFYGVAAQKWNLLYKATKHGFGADMFHRRCDNKGPTMTVIRSQNGYLFGGFTRESWAGAALWKTDNTAFLYTITNPYSIPATKFVIKAPGLNAIVASEGYGPIFGNGNDIHISDDSNINSRSYSNFSITYTDTTTRSNTLFTGALNFATSDIEVFSLAP